MFCWECYCMLETWKGVWVTSPQHLMFYLLLGPCQWNKVPTQILYYIYNHSCCCQICTHWYYLCCETYSFHGVFRAFHTVLQYVYFTKPFTTLESWSKLTAWFPLVISLLFTELQISHYTGKFYSWGTVIRTGPVLIQV